MNIAIAIERFDPLTSGIERSTHQIATHLIGRGHRVAIITGEAPPDLTLDQGEIINGDTVDFRHRVSVSAFARWAPAALARQQPDITLSMSMACPAMLVAPRQGLLAERVKREALAASLSHSKTRSASWQWLNLPRQVSLKRERTNAKSPVIRRFIAISQYVARQLEEHHTIPHDMIELIPNASELPAVSDEQRLSHRKRIHSGFQIAHDAITLLFLAQQNSRLKGIDPLLLAVRKLIDQGSNITLLLAGHIPYRDQLHITRLNLREQVRMIGPTNQMAELLCASDITVMPSFFDPSSKIAIESLMMGVPVVTSRYNGASDFLHDEAGKASGRIIEDPANADELAAAIASFIHPESRVACSQHAAKWREKLAMSRHVDQLESLMLQMAGGK